MARIPFELKGKAVFVAGQGGMVGAALVRRLAQENVELLTVTRSEVDLCDQTAVFNWFARKRPQVVFLAAAKVGGIVANNTLRAEFIYVEVLAGACIHPMKSCSNGELLNIGVGEDITIALVRARGTATDLSPLKWSFLKYDLPMEAEINGKEEAYSGRDYCKAALGRCADGAGLAGGRRGPSDRRDGSNVHR